MAIYHRDKGLPELHKGKYQLFYSRHAKDRAKAYKIATLPKFAIFNENNVVEVEITDFTKYLVRIPYTSKKDLVLAVVLYSRYGIVKTCWMNKKDDQHQTQNMDRYETI